MPLCYAVKSTHFGLGKKSRPLILPMASSWKMCVIWNIKYMIVVFLQEGEEGTCITMPRITIPKNNAIFRDSPLNWVKPDFLTCLFSCFQSLTSKKKNKFRDSHGISLMNHSVIGLTEWYNWLSGATWEGVPRFPLVGVFAMAGRILCWLCPAIGVGQGSATPIYIFWAWWGRGQMEQRKWLWINIFPSFKI